MTGEPIMSSESIIKAQARASLKGNLVTLIAAIGLCFAVAVLIDSIVGTALTCLGAYDFESGEIRDDKKLLYALGNVFSFGALALFSPLINGTIRLAADAAKTGKAKIGDLLYFFEGAGRYLKTLALNLSLFLPVLILSFVLDPTYLLELFGLINTDAPFDDLLSGSLFLLSVIIGVAVKLALYFIFVHYPLFAYSMGEAESATYCVFGLLSFSIKSFPAAIKLFFSFTGWIMLCFFVVPAIYVLPYMLVAMSNSVKWLIHDNRAKGII